MTSAQLKDQEELVRLLRSQEPEGMSYLFNHYSAALYGIVSRIISDEMVAQEVLQDALLKIWNKIEQFNPERGRLFTWMSNISRNLAIDKLRSREMQKASKTDDIETYVSDTGVSGKIFQQVDGIGLADSLKKLREEERFVLEMVYFKGYTQSEITDEFDIPLGTVKTRLRMALINLRKELGIS